MSVNSTVLADRFTQSMQVPAALRSLALVGAGAALVGLLAQVSVPLWPVPITGQTLGVMLVGATLGAKRGASAMLTYLLLGLAGIPWFANFSGGIAALAKPSLGFIIAFIPTAYVIGKLAEKHWDRAPKRALAAFAIASAIPFLIGVPYLWGYLALAGKPIGFWSALELGFFPFIPGGIVKWAIGAALMPALWRIKSES